MIDLLLISPPSTFSHVPPAAPAILAGVAKSHGFVTDYIDWNIHILNSEKNIQDSFRDFSIQNKIIDKQIILNETHKLVDQIEHISPKFIGISVFTYNCLPATKLLCLVLRSRCPKIKIILGGQGLANNGINSNYNWGQQAFKLDLCDFWVKSEGELAIIDILNGKQDSELFNTNKWKQLKDLDTLPYPNYDEYNFHNYEQLIPITASRGCVRLCTFCDIHEHWQKFVYRDGKCVAEEMISQAKKFNIRKFVFTDSLLNGSMKAYKSLITTLADYNQSVENDKKISWRSQFIFRPITQVTDEDWRLTALAGGGGLGIGIESLSEEIRYHMKKKFSNNDIIENLKIMKKYSITCTFLMIVGYVTETEKHINETKEMIIKLKDYAGTTIQKIEFGSTLGILPGTPLHRMYGNEITPGKSENDWINVKTGNTLEKRLKWISELKKYAEMHGFYISKNVSHEGLVANFSKIHVS